MFEKDWRVRLDHIIECIDHVLNTTSDLEKDDFIINIDAIRITERNFEIIAEAMNNIPKNIWLEHPEIAWRKIIDMRNIISHEYKKVDEFLMWSYIKEKLPTLKNQILQIQSKHGKAGE